VVLAVGVGALIAWTVRLPARPPSSRQGLRAMLPVVRRPEVLSGLWLMGLPAIASGMLSVLGPLRLHEFGAPAAVVGATFLVAVGVEAWVSPLVGSLSDRHGRIAPMRFGLGAASIALVCFTLPRSVVPLAAVIVLICTAIGCFWAPAMAMLSDSADTHGLNQALAAALMNLAWAGGQVLGSGGGGAIAKSAGDVVPVDAAAGLFLLTLAALAWLPGLRARPVIDVPG
jgi:predicted MFS family arabinose efflux permease